MRCWKTYALLVINLYDYGDHVSGTFYIRFSDDKDKITREMNKWISSFLNGIGNMKKHMFENNIIYEFGGRGYIILTNTNKTNSITRLVNYFLLKKQRRNRE